MADKKAAGSPRAGAARSSASRGWRQQLAHDPERASRVLLVGGVAFVLLIVLGFIAFGYYDSVIKPRNRTVVQADGIKVSYSAMKRRMTYEYFSNITYQRQPERLPLATYEILLDELTVVNRADNFGVTDLGLSELDREVGDLSPDMKAKLAPRIGVAPEADASQFRESFRNTLRSSGLKEGEYLRIVLADALEDKVRAKMQAELPPLVPQARYETIITQTREAADAARLRVAGGEDWGTVARAVSLEADVQATGGLHDFTTEGGTNDRYRDFVFTTTPGTISDPIEGTGVFYIVRLVEKQERALTADQLPAAVTGKYEQWLADERILMTVTDKWTTDLQGQFDAINDIVEDNPIPAQVPPTLPTVTIATPITVPTTAAAAPTTAAGSTPAAGTTPSAEQPTGPSDGQ